MRQVHTHHAKARMQQRGIPPMMIDLLMQFGKSQPAGGGASRLFFDKNARRRLKSYAGPMSGLLNEYLDVYAVIGPEGQLITAAHVTNRFKTH